MADSGSRKEGREMEWLYKSPQVDREQYLLGRKIDRQVDPLLASEEREKQALATGPGALFIGSDAAGSTADLATKVKEDPLFLIRKKEEEARRRLASNPVKIKQLQQLLAEEKSSKLKKKKRDRSRSPHKKKHSEHRKSKKSYKPKRDSSPHSPSPSTPSTSLRQSSSRHTTRPTRPSGLSKEELEKRRREMMADAESHGHEREQRLRRLEKERQREEKESQSSHSKDFLQPLRVQSIAAAGSLEERIHRSIGSVQRTRTKLDSNFLHK